MVMPKPIPLVLNQSSLQDYLDCPRRFELGALNGTSWPTASSSPLSKFEVLTDLGNQFHQLCHQLFIGIDPGLITPTIIDPDLLDLWLSFLPFGQTLQAFPSFPEQILRIPFRDHYLVAKFDLIVHLPENGYLIIDWKTSRKKPTRTDLANRVQTFLYPFIFQQSGHELFSVDNIPFSSIKMQYWYPLSQEPEEIFPYSEAKHLEVSQNVADIIHQIEDSINDKNQFSLTDTHEHCKYCGFRSICDRGHRASPIPAGFEIENIKWDNTHFDLDLINELEF